MSDWADEKAREADDALRTAVTIVDDHGPRALQDGHYPDLTHAIAEALRDARADGAALMDAEWQVWANRALLEDGDPGTCPSMSTVLDHDPKEGENL